MASALGEEATVEDGRVRGHHNGEGWRESERRHWSTKKVQDCAALGGARLRKRARAAQRKGQVGLRDDQNENASTALLSPATAPCSDFLVTDFLVRARLSFSVQLMEHPCCCHDHLLIGRLCERDERANDARLAQRHLVVRAEGLERLARFDLDLSRGRGEQ